MQTSVRILGIDPGLRCTGWGVIDISGSRLRYVSSGVVRASQSAALGVRLAQLSNALSAVVEEFSPNESAIEETFVNADPRSALRLGHARGVCMLSPARAGIPVAEYAPNLVKKTVAGAGHADKQQIISMLRFLLPQAQPQNTDEADALAIAICHAQHLSMARQVPA